MKESENSVFETGFGAIDARIVGEGSDFKRRQILPADVGFARMLLGRLNGEFEIESGRLTGLNIIGGRADGS